MESWRVLPDYFKRSVVGKLDFKTRCHLRTCSNLDKQLVDSCPLTIRKVIIEPRLGKDVHLSIEEANSRKLLFDKSGNLQGILQTFLEILKIPKSEILKLSIAHFNFQRQPDAINDFINGLFSKIDSKFKFRIEQFSFHWGEIKESIFLELFKKFDTEIFRSLFLRKLPIKSLDLIKELVETEQWNCLEEIKMQEKSPIQFEMYQGIDVVNLVFHCLSAESVWGFIENYKSHPIPPQSFFLIHTAKALPLTQILELFDIPVINEPLEENDPHTKHTQIFPLTWSTDHILVVKIEVRRIKGTICRKGREIKDFDILEIDQLQENI